MSFLDSLLFPRHCILCRTILPTGSKTDLCPICQNTLPSYFQKSNQSVSGIEDTVSVFQYRDAIRYAIRRYKFQHAKGYADWFSSQMISTLSCEMAHWQPDIITYVPLGFVRYHTRGYNQSELLGRRIAKHFQIPCCKTLQKRAFSGHQVNRNAKERKLYAPRSFSQRCSMDLSGKRILLVDDVITTGATVSACGALLRNAGASHIFVVTLAKAQGHT